MRRAFSLQLYQRVKALPVVQRTSGTIQAMVQRDVQPGDPIYGPSGDAVGRAMSSGNAGDLVYVVLFESPARETT